MITPLLEELLRAATNAGASDLLLHSGRPPVLRIGGALTTVDCPPVSDEDLASLATACGGPESGGDFDGGLAFEGSRFRVNLLRQLGSRAAVLRRIRSDIPALESLGLPADLLRSWAERASGIVIVAGATGSGKFTTVAATLEEINARSARHIVTIEDPVEFVFTPRLSLFTQREVGIDTPSFAEGLRRSLRQNPDVIFLGEIRDALSAVTAIQAAETGHLVFATLHASACSDVVTRLELLFPPDERDGVRRTLAAQLLGVLCQRLVPATDGTLALLCEFFSNTGLSRQLIAEGRMPELRDVIGRGDQRSAKSFADSLLELVRTGRVSEAEALAVAESPQEFTRMLRGISSSTQATRR